MKKMNVAVMTLAGLLLIAAAILKAHEVLTVYFFPWHEKGFWNSWEMMLVQIPAEFALGVWLVSGLFRKAAWLAGTAAYCLFIAVTLRLALMGAESCGCFGQVHVNPWVTLFSIDIPFTVLLLIFRPQGHKLLPPPWPNVAHAIAAAVPIFAALLFTAPALVAFRPDFKQPEDWTPATPVTRPDPMPQPVNNNHVTEPLTPDPTTPPQPEPNTVAPEVKPEPDITQPVVQIDVTPTPTLTDPPVIEAPKPWPWLVHVDIADQLTNGIVIVYMYHHDCSTCAASVPKYETYSKTKEAEELKIAYIAIPPYGQEGSGPVPSDTLCLHGKLTDKEKWAITSPFVVALLDGSVVKTWPQGSAPEPDRILDEIFVQ
jgi:hypothetical protein